LIVHDPNGNAMQGHILGSIAKIDFKSFCGGLMLTKRA